MQKGLDGSFVSTMQDIHQDNAYTKEDVYYAEKEIYRKYKAFQDRKGKELPSYSQLSQQDKSEFRSKVETYMEIAQQLTQTQEA